MTSLAQSPGQGPGKSSGRTLGKSIIAHGTGKCRRSSDAPWLRKFGGGSRTEEDEPGDFFKRTKISECVRLLLSCFRIDPSAAGKAESGQSHCYGWSISPALYREGCCTCRVHTGYISYIQLAGDHAQISSHLVTVKYFVSGGLNVIFDRVY